MTHRRLLVAVTAIVLSGASAIAEDQAAVPRSNLLEDLRKRVVDLGTARKNFYRWCTACGGAGWQQRHMAGQPLERRTCPACNGEKRFLDGAGVALYALRSPAWRAQADAAERWKREAAAATAAQWGGYRLDRCDLVDETHAVANVVVTSVTGASHPEAIRWVRAQGAWWLWTDGIDGDWPSTPTAAKAEVPLVMVKDDLRTTIAGRLADAQLGSHRFERAQQMRKTGLLLITLDDAKDLSPDQLFKAIREDARAALRALADDSVPWKRLLLEFRAVHENKFGEKCTLTVVSLRIAREDAARIRWENPNMDADRVYALFDLIEPARGPEWRLAAK